MKAITAFLVATVLSNPAFASPLVGQAAKQCSKFENEYDAVTSSTGGLAEGSHEGA